MSSTLEVTTAGVTMSSESVTMIPSSTTPSPSNQESVWHLVNVLGLLGLLIIVVGPVVYATFCCRKPLHGYSDPCQSLKKSCWKFFSCFWLRKRCGCIDPDAEATSSGRRDGDDDVTTSGESRDSSERFPPVYDVALTMPCVEDTILGDAPPIYGQFFKDKLEKEHARQSTSDGGGGLTNPAFDYVELDVLALERPPRPTDQATDGHGSWDRQSAATASFRTARSRTDSVASSTVTSQGDVETHRRVLRAKYKGLHRVDSNVSSLSIRSVTLSTDRLPPYEEALEILNQHGIQTDVPPRAS